MHIDELPDHTTSADEEIKAYKEYKYEEIAKRLATHLKFLYLTSGVPGVDTKKLLHDAEELGLF